MFLKLVICYTILCLLLKLMKVHLDKCFFCSKSSQVRKPSYSDKCPSKYTLLSSYFARTQLNNILIKVELIKVPGLSCPWAAGLLALLENPHPRLWCTGLVGPAHCAGWSHIRWSLAGSHKDVAAVQCTPPGRGQSRDQDRHSVLIRCMWCAYRDQNTSF